MDVTWWGFAPMPTFFVQLKFKGALAGKAQVRCHLASAACIAATCDVFFFLIRTD
jgi:hypothetical protein